MTYVINTGLLTSLCAICSFVSVSLLYIDLLEPTIKGLSTSLSSQRCRTTSFSSRSTSACLNVSPIALINLLKPSSRTDTYMISLLQFPPRNVKCPRKATRRVLWRYSTFSSRWNVSISDVTIGTQPDVLIRYYITRFTYARELQAKRKGQHVLYGHFNIGPV